MRIDVWFFQISPDGGFHQWGYPQSSSISRWDFPKQKPSSYWGTHHFRKPPDLHPPSLRRDAVEAGALGVFGAHIATGHEERQAQRQQSHLGKTGWIGGSVGRRRVATRKKGTHTWSIQYIYIYTEDERKNLKIKIFKITIPPLLQFGPSKGRTRRKMNSSSLHMPSGYTNFS